MCEQLWGGIQNKLIASVCDSHKAVEVNLGFYGALSKESGHAYLPGVGWEGELSHFKFPFELELDSALLCEIKEQEDLLGSVTSFLTE